TQLLTITLLNERANQLAQYLRKKGVKPNTIVGIMVNRSLEMIIGILAILKAGGAYLPIDPAYPEVRKRYIFQDSQLKVLLTKRGREDKTIYMPGEIEVIKLDEPRLYQGEGSEVDNMNSSCDLVYVIYTSGSTGQPKGVMVEHRNVVNVVFWFGRKYGIKASTHVLQMSDYTFDPSVNQVFGTLLFGGVLYIISKELIFNIGLLRQYIDSHQIHILNFVPAMLADLLSFGKKLQSVQVVLSGGEKLTDSIKDNIIQQGYILYNQYGPTETTIDAMVERCSQDKVTLGKPISNVRCYIFDKDKKLLPIGVPGELYIGGAGVSRGYLRREKLTAEMFIENPYIPGERIYRSGDQARWLPDGRIEFLGRLDQQVKIRGFRLELGEIEAQLLKHGNVKEAVVVADEDERGDKFLCAYIVGTVPLHEMPNATDLKKYLSKILPDYMIPTYFSVIEKIPLNPDDKIDSKKLPKPKKTTDSEYAAPRDELEEKLMEIWAKILDINKEAANRSTGIKSFGIDDNFFELGGHSLKATTLTAEIHKKFDVEVPLVEIFNSPTIRELSGYIKEKSTFKFVSILPVEKKEYYALSSAQKRLYILQQMDESSTVYNMSSVWLLESFLEKREFELALQGLICRHESLRTGFIMVGEKGVQRVHDPLDVEFAIEYYDVLDDFIRPFDLSEAPLLRVGLISIGEEKHNLLVDMHHIISDGASIPVLIREFMDLYSGEELAPIKIHYKDFSEWQNNRKESPAIKEQEDYWLNMFAGEIPVLALPTDYPRPMAQSFAGISVTFELNPEHSRALKKMALAEGVTLYMLLLGLCNLFLFKISSQEDIVIGTPTAGRGHADLEQVIGVFVNTLVLRNFPTGKKTFKAFLNEVKERTLEAFEKQDYQFEDLVEHVVVDRDMSRNPLFDVMFIFQDSELPGVREEVPNLKLTPYAYETGTSKFDLTIHTLDTGKNLLCKFEFCTKLFKKETIKRFITYFIKIVSFILKDPEQELAEIEIIAGEEKRKILYDFNDTGVEFPRDKTIHELFREQVEKKPDNAAINAISLAPISPGDKIQLTYRELDETTNRFARRLRTEGVNGDCIVALMVDRSLEMMAAILGILKAGSAYLPIDPGFPQARIKYMLQDSETIFLITQKDLKDRYTGSGFCGKVIDILDGRLYMGNRHKLENINSSSDLAYLIYTSGSTGKPKGILIEHRNIANFIEGIITRINFETGKSILSLTTISFDIFVLETILPLIKGLKLYIATEQQQNDPECLKGIIRNDMIDMLQVTPSRLKLIMNSIDKLACLKGIKELLVGGEAFPEDVNKNLQKEFRGKIYNLYGPTETTVWSTLKDISGINEINIGKPIANTCVYILDKYGKLQPVGILGELWIGGEGTARGYVNNQELTADKFIPNSYLGSGWLYRTGDLARWLPHGDIEFLGRIDYQVKIRGFRIEVGEIENYLLEHAEIKEAIVISEMDNSGDRYLCAYIVTGKEFGVSELRRYLAQELPDYMIPSYFVMLEKIPLTPNGKVDRKALPKPGAAAVGEEYTAPMNELTRRLAAIWSEVLGMEKGEVGIDSNFFSLGGHSLKATTLVSKIHKGLNYKIPLAEIFKKPTIRGLSGYIETTEGEIYTSIEVTEEREYYPLSSAQKRMYFLQQMESESTTYNIPAMVELTGNLDKEKWEEAFKKLINRHESLRTSFEMIGEELFQRIHREVEFGINYYDNDGGEEESKVGNIFKNIIRPFVLNKAPLLRVALIRTGERTYKLAIDLHHIIADGFSMNILMREFSTVYIGEELPGLRMQYRDFSEWQNSEVQNDALKRQEEYWLGVFAGKIPELNLPTDYERPTVKCYDGDKFPFIIEENLTEKLKELAKQADTTLYMVLLAVLNILLSRYTGQDDIVVGSPITGRWHADLQTIIG
ncbi:MAG: amino acid adenylation domain-containing protein, partial [Candidatus Aminicenantes bacterium]|nr:amino acid adenylation domain-containing protein [Candidatus Aminicenantes bacterium]